ncbi:MAG TPA: hypothetical protein VIT67_12425 [Povalibacter sp.]
MRSLQVFATLAVLSIVPLMPAAAEPGPQEQYAAEIADAEHFGELIYRHDQAAWLATDAVQQLRTDKRVRGWITNEHKDGIVVSFVGTTSGDALHELYRVRLSAEGMLEGPADVVDPPRVLTAEEQAQFKARTTAATSSFERCSDRYNSVVLPAQREGKPTWIVYLLTGVTKAETLAVGGNFRFDVSGDGASVLESRAFTRACMEMSYAKDPDKGEIKMMVLTHLLDPVPTELHAFLSLTSGKSLVVLTTLNNLMWLVDHGRIQFLQKVDPENIEESGPGN